MLIIPPAGGSIRGPAAVMGLFALRPTHSFQNLRGIIELSGFVSSSVTLLSNYMLIGPKKPGTWIPLGSSVGRHTSSIRSRRAYLDDRAAMQSGQRH